MEIWKRTDRFESVREMVNENFAAMDGVLAKKVEVVTGSYVGDGEAERFISLGRTPKALYVSLCTGATFGSSGSIYGGLAMKDLPIVSMSSGVVYSPPALELMEGGFLVRYTAEKVGYSTLTVNRLDFPYRYIAFFEP